MLTGNWHRIELGDTLRQITCLACFRLDFSPPTLLIPGDSCVGLVIDEAAGP